MTPKRPPEPAVLVGVRMTGKTTELLEWVEQGEQTDRYPFWSRVIFTTTLSEADRLRRTLAGRHPEADTYRWVFILDERPHFQTPHPEYAIDNVEQFLLKAFTASGFTPHHPPAIVSICGEPEPRHPRDEVAT